MAMSSQGLLSPVLGISGQPWVANSVKSVQLKCRTNCRQGIRSETKYFCKPKRHQVEIGRWGRTLIHLDLVDLLARLHDSWVEWFIVSLAAVTINPHPVLRFVPHRGKLFQCPQQHYKILSTQRSIMDCPDLEVIWTKGFRASTTFDTTHLHRQDLKSHQWQCLVGL